MGLELATAFIRARGDASKVAGDLKSGTGAITNAAQGLQGKINAILGLIGVGLSINKIVSDMREGIALAEVQIDAEQRIAAVVKGTGMAAGFTAEELKKMASSFQEATTVGDESILELMARLLTFKSVAGDTFKLATEVALDTAAVMGTDARQAALMLGRALEDPIRGVSALRRTGVSFSEQQKVYIKQLVETNKLNEAQQYILQTVRGQMGEVAKAMAQTDAGKMKQLKNTLGDYKEVLGKEVLPVQLKFLELQIKMTRKVIWATEWIAHFVKENRGTLTVLKDLIIVVGTATGVFVAYVTVLKTVVFTKTLLMALSGPQGILGVILAAAAATAAVYAMTATFKSVKKTIEDTTEETVDFTSAMDDAGASTKSTDIAVKELVGDLSKLAQYSATAAESMERLARAALSSSDEYFELEKIVQTYMKQGVTTEDRNVYGNISFEAKSLKAAQDRLSSMDAEKEAAKGLANVYGTLGDAKTDLEKMLGDIQNPMDKLSELQTRLDAQLEAGNITRKEAAAVWQKAFDSSVLAKPGEKLKEIQGEVEKLRKQLAGTYDEGMEAVDKYARTPGVTREQVAFYRAENENRTRLKGQLEDKDDLESIKTKWEEVVKTPMDAYKESMAELDKARGKYGEEDWFTKAEEKVADDLEKAQKQQANPALLGAGSFGFSDFGKQLQNAVLKQDDPQKKIEENTRRTEENTRRTASGFDKIVNGVTSGNTYADAPGGSQ